MATHSSTLVWKTPWMGEPGWPQSTEVQRVIVSDSETSLFTLTPWPSGMSRFSAIMFSDSSTLIIANPCFLEMWTFRQPGNLNLALQRASVTCSLFCSLVWMDFMTWPLWTLATVPWAKGTVHTCLQPRLRPAGQSQMSPGKGCFQGPLGQPTQATGCIYYPTFAVTAHQAPKGNGA